MSKIRKGDTVQVLAGKDLGKSGKVLRLAKDGERVVVEKINMIKRHQKARRQNEPSGIIEKEAALHISNVALVSPTTGKPVRVGFKIIETATGPKKVRVVHKTGEQLDPA
jgi:large subunit ribosomal protein L24